MGTSTFLSIFDIVTKVFSVFSMLISTPIYISVLWFINSNAKKVPFNSPFYTCFTILGIVDLSCYYLYMVKKLQFWDWSIAFLMPPDRPNFACSIVYFLIWFTGMAQWQLNILISLNRFFSLMFPKIYKKYWTTNLNRFYISSVFFLCGSFTFRILWLPTFIQTTPLIDENGNNITKLTGPVFQDSTTANFYNSIWKIHIYAILCICIFCYIPMFVKIRRLNLTNKDTKLQCEIQMLYTLISLLIVNLLYVTFLVTRDYLIDHYKQFGYFSNWFLYILADIYDLHNPYNLLITSRRVRWNTFPWTLIQFFRKKQQIPLNQMLAAANQNLPQAIPIPSPINRGGGVRVQVHPSSTQTLHST